MTNPVSAARRHSFYEIFSGPRPHVERGAEFKVAGLKSEVSRPVAAATGGTVDTSWFRPSAPVSLEALERAMERAGLNPARFTIRTLPRRADRLGDLWEPVLGPGVDLVDCLDRLSTSGRRGRQG